jgi:hypothetical protein
MNKTFIRTNNYNRVVAAVDALVNRDPSLPGLGLIYGCWGYGKTEVVEQFYGISDTFYLRVLETWRPRRLLEEMCEVMKLGTPVYRLDRLCDQVIQGCRRWRKPIFIDEADYLFWEGGKMLNIIRDIHDMTKVPIILIGMEAIYGRLEKYGQFFSRILPAAIVEFQAVTPPEIILIAKEWTGLSIGMEAAELLCRYVSGDFRYVVGYLLTLEEACRTNGTTQIAPKMIEAVVSKAERITKRLYGEVDPRQVRVLGKGQPA